MASSTDAASNEAERERLVAEAIHSGEMEGLHVTPAGRADAEEYVAGRIDSDELVARARTRYGLDRVVSIPTSTQNRAAREQDRRTHAGLPRQLTGSS